MNLSMAPVQGLVFFVLVVLVLFLLRRMRYRHNVRRGKKNPGFYPTIAVLAIAFQNLQKLAEPSLEFVLEEKSDDHADSDDDTDPDLRYQLNRIRNGERLDHITTRLP